MIAGCEHSRRRRRSSAGLARAYTLTEMLVVLVIIGLLATVVGPRLFSRLDDAKQRTARLQIASLETAIDLFELDVGRLPTEEEGLEVLVTQPAAGADGWLGPYLARETLPLDPWNHAYVLVIDTDGRAFHVMSFGADGREGGDGAGADIMGEGRGQAARDSERAAQGADISAREPASGPAEPEAN